MSSGIRATVTFDTPAGCSVARFSAAADAEIDSVATSVATSGAAVTEFLVDDASRPESGADAVDGSPSQCSGEQVEPVADAEPVFSYGSADVYRVEHAGDCPCTCLGQFDCPIHRFLASPTELTVVFHAETFEQLQDVTAALRERFPSMDVQQLLQPPLSGSPEDRRFVNCGKLTDRQQEVLRTAYDRGYFERPRGANATELAAELGISQSTFAEHLTAAQRKLFGDVFDDG
ncbi:helix-turn-helix domain-containing protein [Halolamina rubra]|uniref:helix-turn-helix domain-containing protein n=1 Tax=Halolamina rubra TaxID=1380430 RepID=UPI00067985DF|nr:helix-turn-helix domain-containing protein [Halolamina rubra]